MQALHKRTVAGCVPGQSHSESPELNLSLFIYAESVQFHELNSPDRLSFSSGAGCALSTCGELTPPQVWSTEYTEYGVTDQTLLGTWVLLGHHRLFF